MRYTPGNKYHFIHIDYTVGSPRFGSMYCPWDDILHGMTIKEFTCVEHHKVPGEWDDEKQHDGFIFKDAEGNAWHNQYPRASYGQISTDNDQRLWPSNEQADASLKRVNDHMFYFTELPSFMESVLRGARDVKKRRESGTDRDTPEWLTKVIDSLNKLYKDVDQKLRDEFQLKAVNVGSTLKWKDPEKTPEHHRDIPDVELVPVDQEIEHIEY